jgi:nucleotidyltransferase substrate binding protein (TIGR01987 family)
MSMNKKEIKKNLILNDIDIQPLINMKKLLEKFLEAEDLHELDEKTAMASIQTFEIAYELSWKILQKILKKYSIDVRFSKEVFLKAADIRLIENPKIWFKFLEKRNETVHSYEEEILNDVIEVMPSFIKELGSLIENLKKFDSENKNYEL